MEDFEDYLDDLIRVDDARIIPRNTFYGRIVELDFGDVDLRKFQEIAKKIYILIDTNKIEKDLLFISLLLNKNALDLFLDIEKNVKKLNINDASSILNYNYFYRKHWFVELIENFDDYINHFAEDIKTDLITLKIIHTLLSSNVDLDKFEKYLKLDHHVNDNLLHRLIENMRQNFDVIRYINTIDPRVDLSSLYRNANQMSTLEIISNSVDLKNYKLWPEILTKLEENQVYNKDNKNNDLGSFIAYTILLNITQTMDIVRKSKNECNFKKELNLLIEMCKIKILHLKDKSLQLELLEDVFTLIFGRCEYFSINDFEEFYCTGQMIKLILNFLKHIFEDLKKSYTNQNDYNRFMELQRMVSDAHWRYELVSDVRSQKEDTKSILKFMLSKAEGLINMCLKNNDLDRANQVIQVFNLQKSNLAHEINCSRYISTLKRDIRNIDKQNLPIFDANAQLEKVIEKHTTICQKKYIETDDSMKESDSAGYQVDVDILDILITLPIKYSTYKYLSSRLHDNFSSTFPALSKIYDKTQDIVEENYIPADKLHSSYLTYDTKKYFNGLKQYRKLENVYDAFKELYKKDCQGILRIDHILNTKLMEIQDICIAFRVEERKEYTQYLQKLLKYLQGFARILFSEKDNTDLVTKGKDVSVLEILKYKKADITCKLLYNRNLDGAEFDDLFCKLKLDLPYHISYTSFPQITFDIHGAIESTANLQLQKPRQDVINYVQKRSWFLAFLINKVHGLSDINIERNEVRVKVFTNLMSLPDIQKLKKLFNNNETLTILHQDYSFFLKNYFDELMLADDASTLYDEGYIKLSLPKDTTWKSLYELVLTIPERDLYKHDDIYNLRDILLCNLIKEKAEENYYEYIRYIVNDDLRIRIILEELRYWPGEFCIDILKSQISNCQHESDVDKIILRYKQIEIYMKIKQLCNYSSWFQVDELCINDSEKVMMAILQTTDIDTYIETKQLRSGFLLAVKQ